MEEGLKFPFDVVRVENVGGSYFRSDAGEPFSVGRKMRAVAIDHEFDMECIIVEVRDGRFKGYVPLSDVEVTSTSLKKTLPYYTITIVSC